MSTLYDDEGKLMRAEDFGLVPGQVLKASYVREHPEYPWPKRVLKAAGIWRAPRRY